MRGPKRMQREECVDFCRMLANGTRQRILSLLLASRELTVSQIVAEFELSQPTISHHLGALKRSGLVASRRDGKEVWYSVNRENVASCCGRLVSTLGLGEVGAAPEGR
jgi:ArsR family transcriptional regulator